VYAASNLEFQVRLAQHLVQHPAEPFGSAWYAALQASQGENDLRMTLLGDPALVVKIASIASTEEPVTGVPTGIELLQNYPNPFNPSTTIRYALPGSAQVTLKVFDVLGREVALLADGVRTAGQHEVRFSARQLSSGVCVYQLRAQLLDPGSASGRIANGGEVRLARTFLLAK
jgi:hypothetical protein